MLPSTSTTTTTSNNTLFLVGGIGALGMEVAKGLITARGLFDDCIALVPFEASDVKIARLRRMGWTVEFADFNYVESLTFSMSGAKVVVSTVDGIGMKSTEINVIDAAKSAGASLYVPTQLGADYYHGSNGTSPRPFPVKQAVLTHVKEVGLATLSVFVGFSDSAPLFLSYSKNMSATFLGSGAAPKCAFTKLSDSGFVLAEALADPRYDEGGYLSMQASKALTRNIVFLS
jgi:uncharacterized protein YbjT (DUF2867 family)